MAMVHVHVLAAYCVVLLSYNYGNLIIILYKIIDVPKRPYSSGSSSPIFHLHVKGLPWDKV